MIDVKAILNGTKARNTVDGYSKAWEKFVEYCGSEDEAFNSINLVKWRQYMVNKTNLSANSINYRIHSVRSIINSLAEHRIVSRETKWDFAEVQSLPGTALIERKRQNSRIRISTDQMRALVDEPAPDLYDPLHSMERALLLVLGTTGMRISEAMRIKVDDIGKVGNSYVIHNIIGKKTVEPRVAPLGVEAHGAVMDWLHIRPVQSDYIFVSASRTRCEDSDTILWSEDPMHRVSAYRVVKKYGKRIGMPNIKPHDLRRFVGTQLASKSGIRTAQKVLGHASPDTTARYYIMDDTPIGVTDELF